MVAIWIARVRTTLRVFCDFPGLHLEMRRSTDAPFCDEDMVIQYVIDAAHKYKAEQLLRAMRSVLEDRALQAEVNFEVVPPVKFCLRHILGNSEFFVVTLQQGDQVCEVRLEPLRIQDMASEIRRAIQ